MVPLWLSGRLRGTDQPIESVARAVVSAAAGAVTKADVELDRRSCSSLALRACVNDRRDGCRFRDLPVVYRSGGFRRCGRPSWSR